MSKTPLLLYSDAPENNTGLARICRDLAIHIYNDLNDEFELGVYGYSGIGSRYFPWLQYTAMTVDSITPEFKRVWEDFANGEKNGVIMPIMPPSWIFPLCHPDEVEQENPKLKPVTDWMRSNPYRLCPYMAIEACGPGMKFSEATKSTILRCDRLLMYSQFGKKVAENTGIKGIPYIHHGIYCDSFHRAPEKLIEGFREELGAGKDTFIIGCVASNSGRKRIGTLLATLAYFKEHFHKDVKLWLHTDKLWGEIWSIPTLLQDLDLVNDEVIITAPPKSDQWLANMYSACDATILPTFGEGFGYTLAESLSCGTPCVTGSYACEGEIATQDCLASMGVPYIEGIHNLLRPQLDHTEYAILLKQLMENPKDPKELAELARTRWDWSNQWPKFKEWFLGLL